MKLGGKVKITERGYPVAEVSQRLGVSQHSLCEWKKKFAVSHAKPKDQVLIHSDQGSQFTSMGWASFLKHHNLVHSMSR
ncbi:hypothetical protein C0075_03700 [Rhizobium sp. KAs_5_22]|nr:hypothetical protein C0075_03700 [Rhizobium sp. KAs_5_22]